MTFTFRGKQYDYFKHSYNSASQNMRTVEVPIVLDFLEQHPVGPVLEVGNVLAHYVPVDWDVLDAVEDVVFTTDMMTWTPPMLYQAIVSISTIEHVGHGAYAQLTPPGSNAVGALHRVESWLAPGGEALITVPTAFNPLLDHYLQYHQDKWEMYGMMRQYLEPHDWVECSIEEAVYHLTPLRSEYRWSTGMIAIFMRGEE